MNRSYIKKEEIREYFIQELPVIIQEHPEILDNLFVLFEKRFADKERTEDRIDRVLQDLKQDREYNERRWQDLKQDSEQKWEESNHRWEELKQQSEQKWEESNHRWEELKQESEQKWQELKQESKRQFAETLQEIKDLKIGHSKLDERYQNTIGALGARWGLSSEASFRNGLKAILEDRFQVKVENFNEIDEEGFVFGRPDQVEMDVIITNGDIIICEIKSSMSKSEMYAFSRKVLYYEKKYNCRVTTRMVISPMVDQRANRVAAELGIQVYSSTDQVVL